MEDYILIATDVKGQVAIRLGSFQNLVNEEIRLHAVPDLFKPVMADFLIASVLLGSRQNDQVTTLFKLETLCQADRKLIINCETNSRGHMRAAVFPHPYPEFSEKPARHTLKVVTLTEKNKSYESIVESIVGDVSVPFETYLRTSLQNPSFMHLLSDPINPKKAYGLWIDKLPGTPDEEWADWTNRLGSKEKVFPALQNSDDPDQIVQSLFSEPLNILAVTKPRLVCSCSKDKVMRALSVLAPDDLVALFMEKRAIETLCDYCRKKWVVQDHELKELMKSVTTVQ